MKIFCCIFILIMALGCGKKATQSQGPLSPGMSVCNHDHKLFGHWQGITRQELLIIKSDCTITSLFLNLSGFVKHNGHDNINAYHITITNFQDGISWPGGQANYIYRYNNWGNLEVINQGQILEYYRKSNQ